MAVTLGYWLIAAALVWTLGVVVLVVVGLSNTEGPGRNGCGGDGCRSDAGFHGSGTQPRPAEPARGDTGGTERWEF